MRRTEVNKHQSIIKKVADETMAWTRKEQGGVTHEFLQNAIGAILDYVCKMSNVSTEEFLSENPHIFDYVIDLIKVPRNVISKDSFGISLLSGEVKEELEYDVAKYECLEKQELYLWLSLCEYLIIDKGCDHDAILGTGKQDEVTLNQLTDQLVVLLGLASAKSPKRMGLLMSDEQSGKTLKYTALAAKAFDLGRKIIIIIAGATTFIRGQTQERQEYGVIGLTTDRKLQEQMRKTDGRIIPIGAGHYLRDKRPFVKPITTMDDENLSKSYETGKDPLIFVVKSTKQNLEAVIDFLRTNIIDTYGNPSGHTLPALIVHDECDHSSIDKNGGKRKSTKKKEEEGPSTCNRLIRELVDSFDNCGYLAVSATPFANVMINPFSPTVEKFKKELYPEDFILYSKPDKKYLSKYDFFGLPLEGGEVMPLPLTVKTNDIDKFDEESITSKDFYKNRKFLTEGRPKSLEEALDHFLFTGGLRLCRETDEELLCELGLSKWSDPHSMLIHISESIKQQQDIHQSVIEYLYLQKAEIKNVKKSFRERCKTMWKSVVNITNEIQIREVKKNGVANPRYKVGYTFDQVWAKIVEFLGDFHPEEVKNPTTGEVIHEANVRILNSGSKETLSYKRYWETYKKPLKVIVIGGNVVARGATLEGLCVTYYTRDSVIYDTTLQSGRFFGYYDDWKDLIRVYLTKQSYEIFMKATFTVRSLVRKIQEMNDRGETPMQFGIQLEMLCNPLNPGEKITNKATGENAFRYTGNSLDFGKEIATFYADDALLLHNYTHIQSELTKLVNNPEQVVYEDQFQVWIQDVPLRYIQSLLKGLLICAHSRLKSVPIVLKYMEQLGKNFDVIIPKLNKNEAQQAGNFEFGTGENQRKTFHSIRVKLDIKQDRVGTYFQPMNGRILTTRHLTYGLKPDTLALLKAENEGKPGDHQRINELTELFSKQMEASILTHDMVYREEDVLRKRDRGVIYFYPIEVEPINKNLSENGLNERISVPPIGIYLAFPGQAESSSKDVLYLGNTIDRLVNYFGEFVIGGKEIC